MIDIEKVEQEIIAACKTVEDPEIPVDIYELGLIYKIDIAEDGNVVLEMTLTTPMCPVADSLPTEVYTKVMEIEAVKDVDMRVVYDPPWNKSMMSEEAAFVLDMM